MPKRREPDITMFSFGYWGWGSSTEELVKAADAVERSRGFKPPIFVDIRISRSVRAPGFNGNSFGDLLGDKRYLWMRRLGNRRIIERGKGRIQIDDPSAASDLLDLAIDAAEDNRRIIFFCNCPFPKVNGKIACHRYKVTHLLIKEAKRRKIDLSVIEWPGGEANHIKRRVSEKILKLNVKSQTSSLRIDSKSKLVEIAGIPWGSVLTLSDGQSELHRLACPGVYQSGAWTIPYLYQFFDPDKSQSQYECKSEIERRLCGLNEYRS